MDHAAFRSLPTPPEKAAPQGFAEKLSDAVVRHTRGQNRADAEINVIDRAKRPVDGEHDDVPVAFDQQVVRAGMVCHRAPHACTSSSDPDATSTSSGPGGTSIQYTL